MRNKLKLITIPNEILKKISDPVVELNDNLKILMEDMFEIMYQTKGIGLSAVQVGILKRIVIIDLQEDDNNKKIYMINPEITWFSSKECSSEEGCLSVPGASANVIRPEKIKCKYIDENFKEVQISADGLLARCIQHEIDHLNGILYIDYLSKLKRDRIIKKIEKLNV